MRIQKRNLIIILFLAISFLIGGIFLFSFQIENPKNFKSSVAEEKTLLAQDISQYCLRDDYIVHAQNQNPNGFCWSFANSLSVSTALMKATNQYYDLAEAWHGVTYAYLNPDEYIFGDGGNVGRYYDTFVKYGMVLEADMPYEDSLLMCNETNEDNFKYYNQFANNTFSEDFSFKSYFVADEDNETNIKNHLLNNGSVYVGIRYNNIDIVSVMTKNGLKFYRKPSSSYYGSNGHALSIIGWDDEFEMDINGKIHKGAWLVLNSWGVEDGRSKDGILHIFYDDKAIDSVYGYIYQKDLTSDLYFYPVLEEGYDYTTSLKGAYYGDMEASKNLTKQKNIFYQDDVSLTYSYEISQASAIEEINIYYNQQDVSSLFNININSDDNIFSIAANDLECGVYKVIIQYANDEQEEEYLSSFYVCDGTEMSLYSLYNDESRLNGQYLKYNDYNNRNDNFILVTNKTSGSPNLLLQKAMYSDTNTKSFILDYSFAEGENKITKEVTYQSKTGVTRKLNFTILLIENNLMPVNIQYYLAGGKNNENNLNRMLGNFENNINIFAPTKEGYTFGGWYYDCYYQKPLSFVEGIYNISWESVIQIGSNPTSYITDYYKNYYTNANIVYLYAKWIPLADNFTIYTSKEGKGDVTPCTNSQINKGDNLTFKLTPKLGSFISSIIVDGTKLSESELNIIKQKGYYSFINIVANHTLKVVFETEKYVFNFTVEYGTGFLSQDPNATSGYPSGTMFEYGTRVYVFIVLPEDTIQYRYTILSFYTLIENRTYRGSSYSIKTDYNSDFYCITQHLQTYAVNITLGDYVESVYLYHKSNADASIGLANGSLFEYGTTVYYYAVLTANTEQYSYSIENGQSVYDGSFLVGSIVVTGEVNDIVINAIRTVNKYSVNIEKGDYVENVFLSTDANATSGVASGNKFNFGETVYYFATLKANTNQYSYSIDAIEVKEGIFRIGSLIVGKENPTITINAIRNLKSYLVVFLDDDKQTIINGEKGEYVEYGKQVTPPQPPQKTETENTKFVLIGWFNENDQKVENFTITSNTTYYAKYEEYWKIANEDNIKTIKATNSSLIKVYNKDISEIKNQTLTIKFKNVEMNLNSIILNQLSSFEEDINILCEKIDINSLTDSEKSLVGNGEVYNFEIKINNDKIEQFNSDITLKINHNFTETNVGVYYLKNDNLTELLSKNNNNVLTFATNHFSYFVIAPKVKSLTNSSNIKEIILASLGSSAILIGIVFLCLVKKTKKN